MKTVLIDGSNVSLYSAKSGKLTTLIGLARVVNTLLTHAVLPYTIFDASFRYRTDESSLARRDFVRLIKESGEFFQLAPAGEQADLFLLEAALATGAPILSNDTYRDYGGVKDGVILYQGGAVSVYNFSVFAGSVIIPDLKIRHRVSPDDDIFDEIDAKIDAVRRATDLAPAQGKMGEARADGSRAEIDAETIESIDAVVHRYVEAGVKPLNELGKILAGEKQNFVARTGVGKNGKRAWFGFPTLKTFLLKTFPGYKLGENSIEKGDESDR